MIGAWSGYALVKRGNRNPQERGMVALDPVTGQEVWFIPGQISQAQAYGTRLVVLDQQHNRPTFIHCYMR